MLCIESNGRERLSIESLTGDRAMYAIIATTETRNPRPRTAVLETTRTTPPRRVTKTRAIRRPTDVEISAWARHARGANGFGGAAVD